MKNQAFTLIELLVVVLIIGILAAIALPQYQKAVYKSRTISGIIMLRSIMDAQEAYYLANGEYTDDLTKLDIEVPPALVGVIGTASFDDKYSYACNADNCSAEVNNANMPYLQFNYLHRDRDVANGTQYCHVIRDKNDIAKSICQSLGRLDSSSYDASWFNGKYFILN